ncbi:DUF3710 domain-containing protein [Streptomyces sp. NPDC048717]|uniref:DUF3710 domain-containing protein n=1 Tax=Streptomyces sp. NPDC048717 TaxID=3154928 RepID=UPI0034333CD5
MNTVHRSARRILDEFRAQGGLTSGSPADIGWEHRGGGLTPAYVLLFAVKAVLRLRQESGADVREVVTTVAGDAAERSRAETLVHALSGDMAVARTLDQHGTGLLESVMALLDALIRLEDLSEEEIDELLVHAESLADECTRAGEGLLPALRGVETGPWDESERDDRQAADLIDLGGLRIPDDPGLDLRMDRGGTPPRLLSVTLVRGKDTALQLQAFHSPGGPRWADVMARLARDIRAQGGEAKEWAGRLGPELRCVVPVEGPKRRMPVLMLGCDGPNWLLRGVVSGTDAESVNPDSWVYSYVERVVVAPSYLPRSTASPSAPGFGLAPLGPATGPIPLRMPR